MTPPERASFNLLSLISLLPFLCGGCQFLCSEANQRPQPQMVSKIPQRPQAVFYEDFTEKIKSAGFGQYLEYFQHFFSPHFQYFQTDFGRNDRFCTFQSGRPTGSSNGSLDLLFAGLDAPTLGQSAGRRLNESGSLRKKLRSF